MNPSFLFCRHVNAGTGRDLSWSEWEELEAALDREGAAAARNGYLWLHLDHHREETVAWVKAHPRFPEELKDSLLSDDARPRVLHAGEKFFLLLRGVNCNPGSDPEDMVSLKFWMEAGLIVTLRHAKVMAVDDLRRRLEEGRGPQTPGDFLLQTVQGLTRRMADVAAEIAGRLDELEDEVLGGRVSALRERILTARREVIHLKRYIHPQREVLAKLHQEPHPLFSKSNVRGLRETAEATTKILEDLDLARERAAILQEELNQVMAASMNSTLYTLSIITAIFLPLGFLTGLLGINVGGIPGEGNHHAFFYVAAGLFALAIGLLLYFRRKRLI